jgi:hypothetical protein
VIFVRAHTLKLWSKSRHPSTSLPSSVRLSICLWPISPNPPSTQNSSTSVLFYFDLDLFRYINKRFFFSSFFLSRSLCVLRLCSIIVRSLSIGNLKVLKFEPGSEAIAVGQPLNSQLGQVLNSQQVSQQHVLSQVQHFQQSGQQQQQSQQQQQQQQQQLQHPHSSSSLMYNHLESASTTGNALEIGSLQSFASKSSANFLDNSTFDFKRKSLTDEAGNGAAIGGNGNFAPISSSLANAQGSEMNPNVLSINDQSQTTGSQSYVLPLSQPSDRRLMTGSGDPQPRKERKRKRIDVTDALMPPPTSTGFVQTPLNSSLSALSTQDMLEPGSSNIGSPALRPITLNVKPVGNANIVLSNNSGKSL